MFLVFIFKFMTLVTKLSNIEVHLLNHGYVNVNYSSGEEGGIQYKCITDDTRLHVSASSHFDLL